MKMHDKADGPHKTPAQHALAARDEDGWYFAIGSQRKGDTIKANTYASKVTLWHLKCHTHTDGGEATDELVIRFMEQFPEGDSSLSDFMLYFPAEAYRLVLSLEDSERIGIYQPGEETA